MRTAVSAGAVVILGAAVAVAMSALAGPPAGATVLAVVLILLRERLGRYAPRKFRLQLDVVVAIGVMLFALAVGSHVLQLVEG